MRFWNMRNRFYLTLLLLTTLLTACRFKLDDKIHWDTQLLAPIIQSGVTLADAVQDTNLLQVDGNNFVTMVFRDTLVNLRLIEEVTVPDTSVRATVTLDSISLSTDSLIQDITLADIARQLSAQGNPIGDTLLAKHGQTMFILPGFSGISSGDVAIDASQFFQEATLLSGELHVSITNQLPVDISNVTYHLRNNGLYSDTLIRRVIASVPKGQTRSDTADLSGKTVENVMAGQLENLTTSTEFNVLIDTSDYIRLKIKVAKLKAQRATAIFPAQTVVDDKAPVKYFFGDGVELTRMSVGSGQIDVKTISTINDTLEFIYSLPSARKDGQEVVVRSKLLPAPPGGQVINSTVFDLSGYDIDLTLNGDSVNLFPQRLIGNLIYSGNVVTMDLTDSIYINYGLLDIIPSYVEGYLGKLDYSFQDNINLDFFDKVLGGTFNLKNPSAELTFRNSVGMDGQMQVNSFTAENTRTGQSVTLNAPFLNNSTHIPGPKLPNVGQTVETKLRMDRSNSNIRDFVALLPDRLSFDLDVNANHNIPIGSHENFATDESSIQAFLDLQIPLEGIADQIWLRDTVDMDLTTSSVPDGVEEGTLRLVVENGFPMEAQVQIYFLAGNNQIIDSLFHGQPAVIPAGTVDNNGFVSIPMESTLESFFDLMRMDKLTLRGKRAVASFKLSTKPNGQEVKIYSTYGINFKLIGDFMYQIGG